MKQLNAPPIPGDVAITSTISGFPGAKKPSSSSMKMVDMLDKATFQSGNWQKFIGKQTDQKGNANKGFYTIGIGTCVGIGMTFKANGGECQISLAHLSNKVAEDEDMLTAVIEYMLQTNVPSPERRFVIAFEQGSDTMNAIMNNIREVFPKCGIPLGDETIQLQEAYPTPANLAVNFAPQVGTWNPQ